MTTFTDARRQGIWFDLCSNQESKYLMAEIHYQDFSIATVHQENGELEIEFFDDARINYKQPASASVNLAALLQTLETVRGLLADNKQTLDAQAAAEPCDAADAEAAAGQ